MKKQSPPSVTYPSPNEWPKTAIAITGITRAFQAQVTAPNHGFTSADIGITLIDFTQVKGMQQINGLSGTIVSVIDANNFITNIFTTPFFAYTSGGYVNNLTGSPPVPPVETLGFQTFNTPFRNLLTTN